MTHKENTTLLQLMVILKNTSERFIQPASMSHQQDNRPWLVGGCVRDSLLGKTPKDFDIAVPWDPLHAKKELEENGWKVMEAGLRFEVMHLSKNDQNFEVARFRNDGPYENGKPIWVKPGTLEEDAKRRDFTVNALYLDPFTDEIKDPTNKGLSDIKTKTLRFVGMPIDRLNEDPARIFRFYRFAQKGFKPVPGHLRVVRTLFKGCYEDLAERGTETVRQEIEKMCGIE